MEIAIYDQGFNANAVPRRLNLEEELKSQIYAAFDAATRQTQKGSYGKIKHGSELLKRVSPAKACKRCPHCERFFRVLAERIQA